MSGHRSAPIYVPMCIATSIAAMFAPEGRENEECANLDNVQTQIIPVGVFCIVSHFLSGSFNVTSLLCRTPPPHTIIYSRLRDEEAAPWQCPTADKLRLVITRDHV